MRLRHWRDFFRDAKGGTAVEFAIAFPVVLFTSIAVLEMSMFYFGNQTITNVLNQSVRKGMIGCERSEFDVNGLCLNADNVMRTVDLDSIRRHIARKTYGLVDACDPSKFVITIQPVHKASAPGSIDLGLGGDVIYYKATYNWPVFSPITWSLNSLFDNEFMQFSYATFVRNEKFVRSTAMASARGGKSGTVNDCDWRGKNS